MSARTVGRAAMAHLWRVLKPVLALLVVLGVLSACALLYTSSGREWPQVVVQLLLVAVVGVLLFARFPNGRELTALYLELARLIDQYPHQQLLQPQGHQVVLRCTNRHVRGVIRLDYTKADRPQIDQPGWMPVEEYLLVPMTNQIFQFTRSGDIDEDEVRVGPRATLSGREAARMMRFAFTTSRGLVPVDELRELMRQFRDARPISPTA